MPEVTEESFDPAFFRQLRQAEEKYFWFDVRRKWIYDSLSRMVATPATVLEVGCGTGNVSSFLAGKGYDVTGCEYHQEALSDSWPGFKKVCADAGNLPFDDMSFDVVGLFDVIEHLQDDLSPVMEAYRVLKKGGIILVTVPAREELWSSVDEDAFHKRRYTKERLANALLSAKLAICSIEYMFMALYPIMRLKRMKKVDVRSQFEINPFMNRALKFWFNMERRISSIVSLPIGTSLIATAVKN